MKSRSSWIIAAPVLPLLILTVLLSLSLGPAHIPLKQVARFLFSGQVANEPNSVIFRQIRMPRVLLALLEAMSGVRYLSVPSHKYARIRAPLHTLRLKFRSLAVLQSTPRSRALKERRFDALGT